MATNSGASWFRRLFSRSKSVPLDPTRTDLVIVASSFDDAESCSSALDRAEGWIEDAEAVFRHHLVLPSDTVAEAADIAAQDAYVLAQDVVPRARIPEVGFRQDVVDGVGVTLQRVQVIDSLHCSQERSRMAGLAQRRGGVVLGWDALQPGSDSSTSAD